MSLFADDVLLYMTPQVSTSALLDILDSFAEVSGLEANRNISKALNLTLSPSFWSSLQLSFPFTWFTWSDRSLTFLGIHLVPQYFQANYPPMLAKISFLFES